MKKIRLITNLISILLIIGYTVFLTACWSNIPETVPTHFNALGKADAYGSKWSLIAEPILMTALFLLLAVVERFPSAMNFPVKITGKQEQTVRDWLLHDRCDEDPDHLHIYRCWSEQHYYRLSSMAFVFAAGSDCGCHYWRNHRECAGTLNTNTC